MNGDSFILKRDPTTFGNKKNKTNIDNLRKGQPFVIGHLLEWSIVVIVSEDRLR